jgi:CDP-glucose 4,6-dehydratase
MAFWKNKRVLVTGHTGFKGSWLSLWLQHLGADVCGYSLSPPTTPSLFEDAGIGQGMRSVIADILDLETLRRTFREWKPEIVIHMAAQPLVRKSYDDPLGTYAVNVMGTANLLEAVRDCGTVRAVVVITTDKCYQNNEWVWGYRETDRLGGYDPYSSSKACAELVVSSWRQSFFSPEKYAKHGVAIATVRAGNVIGGGDWSMDRLVPDIVRSLLEQKKLILRNPGATRPWQHVLEPLRGYIVVAERLFQDGPASLDSFNFGPEYTDVQPVGWIARHLAEMWGSGPGIEVDASPQPHEANMLKLDWSKAAATLEWRPYLNLEQALEVTLEWYRNWNQGTEMRSYTLAQIEAYSSRSTQVKMVPV